MKKSKFVTGLSAAFISAMALMSCSSLLRAKDGIILTIDGVPYTAEQLFEDQKTPAAAEAKFNAVYKVAVRAYFTNEEEGKKEMTEITNNTKIKISEQKATAQSNAATNGTSYAVEWQKILDSNGVEDEQGLYDKFEYELQKEKYENNFYDKHYKELKSGNKFPGLPEEDPEGKYKFTSYIEGKQPYHIKHILIKLSSAKAGDSTNAEISSEEASKLAGVVESLANGSSFASVSDRFNEDETAKKSGGSLGIMSRDTSFVNDFKLGIYMYEAFHGSSTTNAKEALFGARGTGYKKGTAGYYAEKISALEEPTTTQYDAVTTKWTNNVGIGQIPYGAIKQLGKYAEYDLKHSPAKERFKAADLEEGDVAAKYLPRNVLFNKYFNKHNIMVITSNDDHNYLKGDTFGTYYDKKDGKYTRIPNKAEPFHGVAATAQLPEGFNRTAKNNDNFNHSFFDDTGADITSATKLLRDENGRVILVFRSGTGDSSSNDAYQGIHFVVIERSPFILEEHDKKKDGSERKETTTIQDYYWHTYPGQKGISDDDKHPVYEDGLPKKTFVNASIELPEEKVLKERADTVKSELKKCDSKLNTYLYQNLTANGKIQFTVKAKELKIEESIDSWIKMSRAANEYDTNKSWDETWQDYYYSLANQIEQRHIDEGTNTGKLVPEMCVASFVSDEFIEDVTGREGDAPLKVLFDKGGVFHE